MSLKIKNWNPYIMAQIEQGYGRPFLEIPEKDRRPLFRDCIVAATAAEEAHLKAGGDPVKGIGVEIQAGIDKAVAKHFQIDYGVEQALAAAEATAVETELSVLADTEGDEGDATPADAKQDAPADAKPATPVSPVEPVPEPEPVPPEPEPPFLHKLYAMKNTQLVAQLEARGIEVPKGLQTTHKFRDAVLALLIKDHKDAEDRANAAAANTEASD